MYSSKLRTLPICFILILLIQAQSQPANHDILLIIDQDSHSQSQLIDQLAPRLHINDGYAKAFQVLTVDTEQWKGMQDESVKVQPAECLFNATILIAQHTGTPMHPEDAHWLYQFVIHHQQPIAILQSKDTWMSETSKIVQSAANCSQQGTLQLNTPHRALLCNGLETMLDENCFTPIRHNQRHSPTGLFVGALSGDPTRHRKKHVNKVQLEQMTIRRKHAIMMARQRRYPNLMHLSKRRRRILCKYRKSCYNTGQVPLSIHQRPTEPVEKVDHLSIKVFCKYRKSCYDEVGAGHGQQQAANPHRLLSGRSGSMKATKPRRKRTVKEMAEIALKHVDEQEQRGALRPKPKMSIVKANLNKMEEKLKKQLRCKYRKSCYETGILPKIGNDDTYFSEAVHFVATHVHTPGQETLKNVSYIQMEQQMKRLFCKYRKSCYATGKRPTIDTENKFKYKQMVKKDELEIPVQIKCHYRKSCYETGRVPDLYWSTPKTREESIQDAPTTVAQLKLRCKYRKSCYLQHVEEQTQLEELTKSLEQHHQHYVEQQETAHVDERTSPDVQHMPAHEEPAEEHEEEEIEPKLEVDRAVTTSEQLPQKVTSKKRKSRSQKKVEEVSDAQEKGDTRKTIASHKRYEVLESDKPRLMNSHRRPIKHRVEQVALKRKQAKLMAKRKHIVITQVPQRERKLLCKYRKSCYANGVLSLFAPPIQEQQLPPQDQVKQLDETELKLFCKYRKSCYDEIGTQYDRQPSGKRQLVLGGKGVPVAVKLRPKRSVKEMAEIVLKRVDKKEKLAAERPKPKMAIAKQELSKAQKAMHRRLECKYRKSCYESGVRPRIEYDNVLMNAYHYITRHVHVHTPSDEQMASMTFDQLDHDHKRLFCKYRKSCYDNGVKPHIEHEERFNYKHIINKEEVAISLEIKCHYRKSCYETGLVPQLRALPLVEPQQKPPKTPETISELKVHCKYRKSCYVHKMMDQPPPQQPPQEVKPKIVKLPPKVVESKPTAAPETTPQLLTEKESEQSQDVRNMEQSESVQEEMETLVQEAVKPEAVAKPSQTESTSVAEESDKAIRQTVKRPKAKKKESESVEVKRPTETDKSQLPLQTETQREKDKTVDRKVTRKEKQQKPTPIKPQKTTTTKPTKREKPSVDEQKPTPPKKEKPASVKPVTKQKPRVDEQKPTPPKKEKPASVKPVTKQKQGVDEQKPTPTKKEKPASVKPVTKQKPNVDEQKPTPVEIAPIKTKPQTKVAKEDEARVTEKKSKKVDEDSKKLLEKVIGKIKQPISADAVVKQLPSIHHKEIYYKPPPPTPSTDEEEIPPIKEVQIDDEVDTLHEKLRCKYRKSCYNNKTLPHPFQGFKIKQVTKREEQHIPIQYKCKYRKSCYDTGEAPRIEEKFKVKHLVKKQEEHIPVPLRCKYRKSCYETGKVPEIDRDMFITAAFQNLMREYQQEAQEIRREMSQEERKLSCKYRKSCYQSGKLPEIEHESIKSIADTMKETQLSLHLRCKYRKSCYAQYGIPIAKPSNAIRQPEAVIAQPTPMPIKDQVKVKMTGEERKPQQSTTSDDSDENKKKGKKVAKKEDQAQYMQLEPQVRPLSTAKKLKCKYRIKCYQGVPLRSMKHELRKEAIPIKSFTRTDGRPCTIYHLSCRKMAGLPIKERAPIGPNGRRLCRKKPKVEATAM